MEPSNLLLASLRVFMTQASTNKIANTQYSK